MGPRSYALPRLTRVPRASWVPRVLCGYYTGPRTCYAGSYAGLMRVRRPRRSHARVLESHADPVLRRPRRVLRGSHAQVRVDPVSWDPRKTLGLPGTRVGPAPGTRVDPDGSRVGIADTWTTWNPRWDPQWDPRRTRVTRVAGIHHALPFKYLHSLHGLCPE